jgi:hypothetical protein
VLAPRCRNTTRQAGTGAVGPFVVDGKTAGMAMGR